MLLVSQGPGGVQGTGTRASTNGTATVASHDGRLVAFSTAAALVPQDTNEFIDVYLRDKVRRTTTLVSTTASGALSDGDSFEPTLSADGRSIAFTTAATNLVRGLGDEELDVVARDLRHGAYQVVSQTTAGQRRPGYSFFATMAGDGRYVAFQSFSRLAPDDRDDVEDVFVRDLRRRTTKLVSIAPGGRPVETGVLVGGISWHGKVVTFGDDQHAWARDVHARRTTVVWQEPKVPDFDSGTVGRPAVSGNGRFVAFSSMQVTGLGDTRGFENVYRRDLRTGRLERVTYGIDGAVPDGDSFLPSLSRSGRYVGLGTFAGNLVRGDGEAGDGEAVVVDQRRHRTTWASPSRPSPTGESARSDVAISADGNALVYASYDDLLTPEDRNGWPDVFVWKR